MPIKPNFLSSPDPDTAPEGGAEQATVADTTQAAAETQQREEQEQPAKRRRRTKAEMIADAVVPGPAELVEVKDLNTGAEVQRAWNEAVPLVESGAAEFVDKELKYAVLKQAQQEVAPAFATEPAETPLPEAEAARATHVENLEQPTAQSGSVPPGAALGDEVRVGSETYRVGNGGVLTSGPIVKRGGEHVTAKRRWQRELGAGSNGPWESVALTQTEEPRPIFDEKAVEPTFEQTLETEDIPEQSQNGNGVVTDTQKLPHTQEEIAPGVIKVTTGILEKIGLPQAQPFDGGSSLQVGPITLSRTVIDDGRRSEATFADGRTGEVITAAVEAFEVMDNTCEFIAARFRGQLKAFLQSTGALKQPVA